MKYQISELGKDQTLMTLTDEDFASLELEKTGHAVTFQKSGVRKNFLASAGPQNTLTIATELGSYQLVIQKGELNVASNSGQASLKAIKSSMPGRVVKVLVKEGDVVSRDSSLLILEAMKMENEIRSPLSGVVKEVKVSEGKKVETGELLLKIESNG